MKMDLLRVHSQDLHEHIAQEVGECLDSGLYTDLAIRCAEGQVLHAHRLVLSAVSPYLQFILETAEPDEVQTIEMSSVSSDEMQMLLEVVYNGVVEATIEDLRKLILLAHRLYITIPLSNELMQGLDLKLPTRPPFRKPLSNYTTPKSNHSLTKAMSKSFKSIFNGTSLAPNLTPRPSPGMDISTPNGIGSHSIFSSPSASGSNSGTPSSGSSHAGGSAKLTPKLHIDPTTMTSILAASKNSEHVCPICNSKYNNVGNFKQHMKTHDNEELREQRNAILSEMIATCFNPQTSLYTCHVCNSNYNHSGNFKQHLLKHERESGSISATLVAQAGSNPHLTNVLQSAMADRVDNGDKPVVNQYQYQCEHCDRSFKHPGNYKQHLTSHMRSTKFEPHAITNTINKVNSILGQAKAQTKQQQPLLPLATETKPETASSTGSSNSVNSMQMVACPECHLEFPGIDLLQAHISVSHKHLDVKLPSTDQDNSNGSSTNASNDQSNAKPNWQTALEEAQEPFKCNICGKGFQKTSKLTAHMKIHRAPEEHYNHPCDICGKKFTRPQHVARHKMLHTGERPFRCPKCPRQFTREDKLRHHLADGECGGMNPQAGGGVLTPGAPALPLGLSFGSLWGGANGEMLAGMLNNSSNEANSSSGMANGNDSEAMDQSEASNDSSKLQAGVMAT